MDELEMIGRAVIIKFAACIVINTGDLLAGKTGATRHEVLDAMIAHWMSDPVHGTKTGYSKLAMKLADRVEADSAPKNLVKKTTAKKPQLLLVLEKHLQLRHLLVVNIVVVLFF